MSNKAPKNSLSALRLKQALKKTKKKSKGYNKSSDDEDDSLYDVDQQQHSKGDDIMISQDEEILQNQENGDGTSELEETLREEEIKNQMAEMQMRDRHHGASG